MISRRHTRLIIALLLPLMVLRAMLPPGYMPVAENGTLHIAMCSDGLYPAAADQGRDQTKGGDHKLPSDPGSCPFANAAVNAAPPAASPIISMIAAEVAVVPDAAAPVRAVALVRVQSARGPPSISL